MGGLLVAHAIAIVHGIGASLAFGVFLYIAGILLIPGRLEGALGPGEPLTVLGAAAYVLACWFGVRLGVPLTRIVLGFAVLVGVLAAVRYRWLMTAVSARALFTRVTAGWLLTFSLLYVLAYVFTMPPAGAEYLPLAWAGNVDLLTYARYTRYLQLGLSNPADFAAFNGFEYLQTPAVFSVLGGLSVFFGQDPLRATMPAQFAFSALIGVFAARISRAVFNASRVAAVAIACILVSGPFFRYVAGNFFLSTLMATPVLLYLIWTTVSCYPFRAVEARASVRFGSAHLLLLLLYPLLFFAGIVAQAIAVCLMFVAEGQSAEGRWRPEGRHAPQAIGAILLPLAVLVVCFWNRVTWALGEMKTLSRVGFAGWPLGLISPLTLLGFPGAVTDQVHIHVGSSVPALVALWVIAVVFGLTYFFQYAWTTPMQRAMAGMAAVSLVLYGLYFVALGPSYQQWKFASYFALPLSFVVFAGGLQLFRQSAFFAQATRSSLGHRPVTALLAVFAGGLIGGNLLVHAQNDPPAGRYPAALSNLAAVNRLPFFKELSVQMTDDPWNFSTWLALYYLPSKRVSVISSRFRPNEPLSLERISRHHPLFIQNYGCEGVGHDDTIAVPDVGCLLLAPPSLVGSTRYPFNRTFLFVSFEGLGSRRPEGRRSNGTTVSLKLTADLRRTSTYRDGYVNLRLGPNSATARAASSLAFLWGDGRHGTVELQDREWLSLPIRENDWAGNRVRTLAIAIALEDGASPLLFEEVSVSPQPAGRAVKPL